MVVETYPIARESVNRLRREVCRPEPDLRRVVEIRESKDATLQEIASFAGITVAATKSRLLRVRRILRREWDKVQQRNISEIKRTIATHKRAAKTAKTLQWPSSAFVHCVAVDEW